MSKIRFTEEIAPTTFPPVGTHWLGFDPVSNRLYSIDSAGTVTFYDSSTAFDTLAEILVGGNTTEGTDIIITAGDNITFNSGAFIGRISPNALTDNRDYSWPDASGTLALTTDIPTLAQVLTAGNATGANPISMGVSTYIEFNDGVAGSRLNSLTTTGLQVWSLPDKSGTIAMLSDIVVGAFLPLAGGTMTGSIDLAAGEALQLLDDAYINLSTNGFAGLQYQSAGNELVLYNNNPNGAVVLDYGGAGNGLVRFENSGVTKAEFTDAVGFAILDTLGYRFGLSGAAFTGTLVTTPITTSDKTWTLPDNSGTVALTSDLAIQATETTLGIAEIATQPETHAGTDDLRYITPLKLESEKGIADGLASLDATGKVPSSQLSGGGKSMILSFAGGANASIESTAPTYAKSASLIYAGSTAIGTINSMAANIWVTSGSGDIRIFDITNAQEIATVTGIVATAETNVIDLGTISNVPTGQAVFEVQLQKAGGGAKVMVGSLEITY